jgi:hypothetical protein
MSRRSTRPAGPGRPAAVSAGHGAARSRAARRSRRALQCARTGTALPQPNYYFPGGRSPPTRQSPDRSDRASGNLIAGPSVWLVPLGPSWPVAGISVKPIREDTLCRRKQLNTIGRLPNIIRMPLAITGKRPSTTTADSTRKPLIMPTQRGGTRFTPETTLRKPERPTRRSMERNSPERTRSQARKKQRQGETRPVSVIST